MAKDQAAIVNAADRINACSKRLDGAHMRLSRYVHA